jgi:hypothetical protein
MRILECAHIVHHEIHRSNLIIIKSYINSRGLIFVFVEHWIFCAEILLVFGSQQRFDGSTVKCKVRNHSFDSEL